jgi:predicted transcriptional regulator
VIIVEVYKNFRIITIYGDLFLGILQFMAKKVTASQMPNALFIDNAEILGQVIKAKRTSLGIKLADCAALCGIGINTLSRIENGNANCTVSAVFSVLNGLGIKLTSKELGTTKNTSSIEDEWI